MHAPAPAADQLQLTDVQIGRVLRAARLDLGLDTETAGRICGYSASTVSRWENGKRRWTLDDLAKVAAHFQVPRAAVGLADPADSPVPPVARRRGVGQTEPMKRRAFIAATLSAVSAATLGSRPAAADETGIEQALFGTNDADPVALRLLAGRVAAAEHDLEAARLAELDRRLPALLRSTDATWKAAAGTEAQTAASLLSRALSVTAQQQIRLSRETVASVAAERAARSADAANDPLAAAEAARNQAVVLRRTGSPLADQVMVDAAERLRADTALATAAAAGKYAQILASAAYTCAGRDDRSGAADCLEAAQGALAGHAVTPHLNRADLAVYVVSCDRVLGDHGAALHHAQDVELGAVSSLHEQGRLWQDVAIAAYGRGRIDRALDALAELDSAAPQYLNHRPWARDLVDDLLHTREGGGAPLLQRLAAQLQLS